MVLTQKAILWVQSKKLLIGKELLHLHRKIIPLKEHQQPREEPLLIPLDLLVRGEELDLGRTDEHPLDLRSEERLVLALPAIEKEFFDVEYVEL